MILLTAYLFFILFRGLSALCLWLFIQSLANGFRTSNSQSKTNNGIDNIQTYDIISSRKLSCGFFLIFYHLFATQLLMGCVAYFMPKRRPAMKNETFMKEKPVLPLIISMALPMVISMCVNSLYNIVDSFFVAKISEDAMTALSLIFPVQNFINAVAIGFGVGINAVIAFQLGAKDVQKADSAATQGLVLSLIHGVVLTVVPILIMRVFLTAFTKDETVISLGIQYCNVVFLFTVINSLNLFFEKL